MSGSLPKSEFRRSVFDQNLQQGISGPETTALPA
jgi:hypothetical protein